MKTIEQLEEKALRFAESFFYSDIDEKILWHVFEGYDEHWIQEEIDNMCGMLIVTMQWAQREDEK